MIVFAFTYENTLQKLDLRLLKIQIILLPPFY